MMTKLTLEQQHSAEPSSPLQSDIDSMLKSFNAGRFQEAGIIANQLTEQFPDHAFGWKALGAVFERTGNLQAAVSVMHKATELDPGDAESHYNLAIAEKKLGNLTAAVTSLQKSIALKPDYLLAYNNLGNAFAGLQQFEAALQCFDAAIRLKPNYHEAYNNRANVLQALKRSDEALKSYERALEINPNYAQAHDNHGNLLQELGRLDEALMAYDKAIAIRPDSESLANRLLIKMRACIWQGFEAEKARIESDIRAGSCFQPWHVLSMSDDPEINLLNAQQWCKAKFPDRTTPHKTLLAKKPGDKLRIGYYSADFHNHATMHLMAELFESHDKSQFEIYGFSFGPDIRDEMRDRAVHAFNKFLDVSSMSDLDIAQLSRSLGIDIAVDLKGHSQHARTGIFAARCAPIQINYLGFPGSIGAPYIYYIIADEIVIPLEDKVNYIEKVAYVSGCYLVNDSNRKISDKPISRTSVGLPEDAFVFACFNNNYKILPSTFESWVRIIKSVPNSVLWLLEDNPTAARNLRMEAENRHLDPRRLVFAKRIQPNEHLARHRLADLFLDTLPFNAHTTASDALWAGLPVLTLRGNTFAGRVAASLLHTIGLPELITTSVHEYEQLAINLALDLNMLLEMRRRLSENKRTTSVFDGKNFAREIERVYQSIYKQQVAA